MKVTESPAAVVPAVTARVVQGSARTDEVEQKSVKDKVSFSTPQQEAAITAARSSLSSSRAARVQEVINAVRSGQYYPSPQQIAQKLVSEAEVEAHVRTLLAK